MLEQVETIFDERSAMLTRLKRTTYEKNTDAFSQKYGHYVREMVEYVDSAEDKEQAAGELAEAFCDAVEKRYTVKGKIKGIVQAELNMFMIYYVFPAILMTEDENAEMITETLCNLWGKRFKDSKIGYTNYDNLYESFHKKIFGFF
jgi:hypothetical protein